MVSTGNEMFQALVGENSSKGKSFQCSNLGKSKTSKESTSTSNGDCTSSHSRGGNNEGRSGGSENGAQKAEKGQTKDKFGFHLKENKGLDREWMEKEMILDRCQLSQSGGWLEPMIWKD